MRRLGILLVAAAQLASAAAHSTPAVCDRTPRTARWQHADPPDAGLADMRITVHRGAAFLAPENTIPAFEYAIAYGLDMIEVDVQQTLDGRYVVFHDYDMTARTGQPGFVPLMTYEEVTSREASDDPERQDEYAGTKVPGLEAVLDLASRYQVGINFDLKESVWNAAGVALLAAKYPGVIERSIFQPYVPGRTEQILAAAPDATVMFNSQFAASPAMYYAFGAEYHWFGGSMSNYSREAIVAIHDACRFVQPNVYSSNKAKEAADLAAARAAGADGAMVDHPDVAADVLDEPVATEISVAGSKACLTGHGRLGLPGKVLEVDGAPVATRSGGCVDVPAAWSTVAFSGDGSALASSVSAG